jgi:hypothetical protein
VGVLGVLLVGYVAARPMLAASLPHLGILEYPVGLVLGGLLVYVGLRRPKAEREPPVPEWRRHVQVVRPVPDAERTRHEAPLRAWVERGEDPAAAALVIARARTRDPAEAERLRSTLTETLAGARSPKARRNLLTDLAKKPKTGA